jgi:acyl dehydratase
MANEQVYFEDLEPGRTWKWGEYLVTREEIVEFARMYDPQPFHLDEAAALASVFRGFAASSIHTIALENKMFHLDDGPRFVALAQLGMTDLAFPAPVMAGDRLRIVVECISRRESQSKPDRGVVVEQCTLLNQDGVECFRCTHTILVPRRTA